MVHLDVPPGRKQSDRLASPGEGRVVGDGIPEPVAAQGAAQTHAHVVVGEVGHVLLVYPDSGSGPQPVARIEPQHLSMKLVATGRGHHIDHRAQRPAELRFIATRCDLDCLHEIERQVDAGAGAHSDVHSVDEKRILQSSRAAHVHSVAAVEAHVCLRYIRHERAEAPIRWQR